MSVEEDLISKCPINIYVASNMDYEYPYKLQHSGYASERIRNTCEDYIADSDINNPEAGNKKVLAQAEEYNAEYVIPADVLHNIEGTEQAVSEFQELRPSYDTNATMLHPIQPPHTTHLSQIEADHICLGGLKDASPNRVISVLESIDPSKYEHIHLLGVASRDVLSWLRDNPVIDSLDATTPEDAAMNSSILTQYLEQRGIDLPSGTFSSALRYQLARYNALVLNMLMTPECDAIQKQGFGAWV